MDNERSNKRTCDTGCETDTSTKKLKQDPHEQSNHEHIGVIDPFTGAIWELETGRKDSYQVYVLTASFEEYCKNKASKISKDFEAISANIGSVDKLIDLTLIAKTIVELNKLRYGSYNGACEYSSTYNKIVLDVNHKINDLRSQLENRLQFLCLNYIWVGFHCPVIEHNRPLDQV